MKTNFGDGIPLSVVLCVDLIIHVCRVIQLQIETSRFDVKCPDLIGDAGGQYMFFLYLFYRLRLSKVSQSVSNKSYLILSYLTVRAQL